RPAAQRRWAGSAEAQQPGELHLQRVPQRSEGAGEGAPGAFESAHGQQEMVDKGPGMPRPGTNGQHRVGAEVNRHRSDVDARSSLLELSGDSGAMFRATAVVSVAVGARARSR